MLHKKIDEIEGGGNNKPKLDVGQTYPAIIDLLIDLGDQRGTDFNTKEPNIKRKLWVGVCFPTEVYEVEMEGEVTEFCQVLGKSMNVAKGKKAELVLTFDAVCKTGESIADMLGKACSVVVKANGAGNPAIEKINGPIRGSAVKLPEGRELTLITEDDWPKVDADEIGFLPDFLKRTIRERVGGPEDHE